MKTPNSTAFNMIILLSAMMKGKVKAICKMIVLTSIHIRTFPRPLDEFGTYADAACKHLFDNYPRLISEENKDALHVFYDEGTDDEEDWLMIRKKTGNATTTGTYWTKKQGVRRHDIEQLLLKIYGDIPASVWKDADRKTLRQPLKAKKSHKAHIMEVAPDMTLEELLHKGFKLHFQDPETPDSDQMPDYQQIILEYFLGEKGLKETDIIFGKSKTVTTHLYSMFFTAADVGKTIYLRCRYVNTTGKEGKVTSKMLAVEIPR